MADWSQLPKDLLHLISEKLNTQFYQLRFRSVCSSWRSSTPQNHHHHHLNLPPKFPIPSNNNSNNNDDSTFPLSKRTLFLISPPPNQQTLQPWLIKIGPDSRDQTRLWHPLSRDTQFSIHFPNLIDFNHLPIIDLGCEFVIGNFPSQSPSSLPLNNSSLYMEKVVVFDTWQNGNKNAKEYQCSVLLTIHISGKLAVFRCGDEWCDDHWTIIPDMLTPYDDVCVYKGRLVAVDSTCPAVIVGRERAVRFDEKEKKWVEVKTLEDRVLFLGEDCAFSASAFDLRIGYGNCVIFRDDVYCNSQSIELGEVKFKILQVYPMYKYKNHQQI